MKRETISLDSIEKGQRVMALVDVNQIWFIDNKFGVTLRLQQLMADRSEKLKRFAFDGPDVPPMSTEEEEEEVEVEVDDDNMSEEMVDEE